MKLLRYGQPGQERPGMLDSDGNIRDLSVHLPDLGGTALSPAGLKSLRELDPAALPVVDGAARLGPPVAHVGKFIGIGLNFSDHAQESNMAIPKEPPVFSKASSCIVGPNDDVIIPRDAKKVDWEVELAMVIGTRARYVSKAEALGYVAGFCIVNDVSEREYQLERGPTWDRGKGCDTFGPMGPWLVTLDELGDPHDLGMWLNVNGRRMQTGNTRNMIFDCASIVSYVSDYLTLLPGDVITTGTPPGVGMGKKPDPVYLKPGDVMRLGIDKLGVQQQRTISWSPGR